MARDARQFGHGSVKRRTVIAVHLIHSLYGHWAVNDPRGSGSAEIGDDKFAPLGDIYHGRKPEEKQPSREELKAFHREHRKLLNFPLIWIDAAKREAVAQALSATIQQRGYTCYACAVCANHFHLVIRTHRDHAPQMWELLAQAVREKLRGDFAQEIVVHHPVVAARPYNVLLYTIADVWSRVRYVERNPQKEGLPKQQWEFVTTYDNWPQHKK